MPVCVKAEDFHIILEAEKLCLFETSCLGLRIIMLLDGYRAAVILEGTDIPENSGFRR